MWQSLVKEEPKGKNSIYRFTVSHVDDIVIDEGPAVYWGTKHPYGWDRLNEAIAFLYERLNAEGFYGGEPKRKSSVTDLKEKFGSIRLYICLYPEDRQTYKSILSEALKKFSGSAPFFAVDDVDETEVFVGTEKDFKNWKSQLKPGDLETLIRKKNPA